MAVDYYLKIDGMQGEATDADYKDQINLLSFSWGGNQVSSAGTRSAGSGAGKVELSDFSVVKHYDKSSPQLFKSLVSGTHSATGVLSAVKAGSGGKPFLKISFEELFVTSIHVAATDELPTESVSLSYKQIKIEYSTQNEKGTLTAVGSVTYNIGTNKTS
ncbi:MAG: type VI secretion system tube protein Hcp [Terracidiphilus sp.]|jgi:type VI secretion system secreted protein Hcp